MYSTANTIANCIPVVGPIKLGGEAGLALISGDVNQAFYKLAESGFSAVLDITTGGLSSIVSQPAKFATKAYLQQIIQRTGTQTNNILNKLLTINNLLLKIIVLIGCSKVASKCAIDYMFTKSTEDEKAEEEKDGFVLL